MIKEVDEDSTSFYTIEGDSKGRVTHYKYETGSPLFYINY